MPYKPTGQPVGRPRETGDARLVARALQRYSAADERLEKLHADVAATHRERVTAIDDLLAAGMSISLIAKTIGVSRETIYAWRRGHFR